MKKQLDLVHEFHEKCRAGVGNQPQLISDQTSLNRYKMMREEVEEYLEGTQKKDLPNIAKELCDILYSTYGTILEHGLQDKMEEIFEEVHKSNMTKEFNPIKAIKGKEYKKANLDKFFK
ncbi:nucleoside triphosphate pyrophosphohydrolase family protein [Candidatus Kaiserbacteria bacterium]|nr:nucleoside triphosphate pyrophosphohydrolase family protein [Candidatus Kaiserbacteria bacterium]